MPTPQAWDALVRREREQRALLANISGMVYRGYATPPWRLTYVSEGVEALTGYPPSFFLEEGHRWAEIMVPEDVDWVAETLARGAVEGREIRVEYRIRCRDGSVRWVDGRVRTTPGDPPVYSGTVFDIDERKRTEQALADSREHQRFIIDSVPSSLWTATPDGAIDFVSRAGQTYVGATAEQRLGHGWLGFVHPEDVDRVRARWQQSLTTGELYEAAFRQSDLKGGYRYLQARAICRRDPAGEIVRWYGTTADVTPLVQTQFQLRESEELASATIRTVPGIVWRAEPSGRLTFISEACESQLGWQAAEVLGNRWMELVHPEDAPKLTALWRESLRTGAPIETRYRVRDRHGNYRWHQIRAIAARDPNGSIVRWNGLLIDIEELLKAQIAAESATRAKSAFLSTMSHEIRTPLNAVLGYSQLLRDTALTSEQREFVQAIRASGDHLLEVISDILDFSKLESGHLALDFALCDVRQIVESALDLVAHQAARQGLELLCHIEDEVPTACWADASRVRQVLVNLLSNAVKFTSQGEVEVLVSARRLTVGDVELDFRVRDTGIGIAPDKLDGLFRDFNQLDNGIARRYGGTGLGLAISRRLVEAHGGYVRVSSAPGQGSIFWFCLPVKASDQDASTPARSGPGLRGRRALVIDDHPRALEFQSRLLREWGMEVLALGDPHQALPEIERALSSGAVRPFDVVLIDQHLPGMLGTELASTIAARIALPTIILLPPGSPSGVMDRRIADPSAVVTKPVGRGALLDALCRLLRSPISPITPESETSSSASPMPALRLLLVEDNIANRKVAQLLLRKLGYPEVDIAVDGNQAVDAVFREGYDVVLMDVQMPELDGLDATRKIRGELPNELQPQILALTANATMDDREACLRAGMDGYLAKPIDLAQLERALRAAADRIRHRSFSAALS